MLIEARKHRRSLRQALLASGCLTVYQMAIIEAGDLDRLMLGPVRVIDRLRATAHEAVYRVFDPRSSREALLRHLAESEMDDAVRPDEFRQRFTQAAAVQHPHLAGTFEVLEINGRPAVLQEWVNGLPSTEWPALASAPGAWFRLINQAALGLFDRAPGRTHARSSSGRANLPDGGRNLEALRVRRAAVAGDGRCLFGRGRGRRRPGCPRTSRPGLGRPDAAQEQSRGLTEPLQGVLARLQAESPEERYASAAALLEDLERAGADVPANATAWERLLKQVREQGAEDPILRQSA